MQPSIFGKELGQVTYDDVVQFCNEQAEENLGLDYKRDLSSLEKIVKTLVSFANTNGGWVIVGVDDDGHDKPKLPVVGMAHSTAGIQQITNSLVSTLNPIVIPHYQECVSNDGKHMFLVIFMPQSPSAPHFMRYKKKNALFVRISDRSSSDDWEEHASSAQWEMLRIRRTASIELRDQLVSQMKGIYETKYGHEEQKVQDQQNDGLSPMMHSLLSTRSYFSGEEYEKTQTVSLLPTFPNGKLTDIGVIDSLLEHEPVSNPYAALRPQTPDGRGYGVKTYQNGSYIFYKENRRGLPYYFFGLDVYGNIINVDPMELYVKPSDGSKTIHFVGVALVTMQLVGVLRFASHAYKDIGYLGNLIFRTEFNGTENVQMYTDYTDFPYNQFNKPENITGSYLVQRDTDTNMLFNTEARIDFVTEIVKEILQSFNFKGITDEQIITVIRHAEGLSK